MYLDIIKNNLADIIENLHKELRKDNTILH